jgi:hypothetical protein
MKPARASRTPALERAASIALRTVHLASVVGLGAALLGAPLALASMAAAVAVSGGLLFAMELFARRLHVLDFAGLVVVAKLALVGWLAAWPGAAAHALAVFWALVTLSSVSSHAPKPVRHWRPGR